MSKSDLTQNSNSVRWLLSTHFQGLPIMQRRCLCTMGRSYLFEWFLLVICLRAVSSVATCRVEERQALLDFIKEFELDTSELCDDPPWNTSLDCCKWNGIGCGKTSGHVQSVQLRCLRGPFLSNSSIFRLRFLKDIQISGSDFQKSSLHNDISKLSKLRMFHINDCNLSGNVPIGLCNLKNLRFLRLYGNGFTGTLPSCLFDLPKLQDISLFRNRLEGPLPIRVNYQTRLDVLLLSDNQINGAVPSWLFTHPSLFYIDLRNNNLTGPLEPFEPPSRTVLHTVLMANNSIRGSVPSSLFQLVNVSILELSDNQLSGDIDWNSLKEMRNIENLQFSGNRGLSFKNSNGSSLQFPKLWGVNISFCNTTEFPSSLGASASLSDLDISNNNIGGRIFPRGSGRWKGLVYFYASHNLIAGFDEIPEFVLVFDLSHNRLQGPVLPLPTDMFYFFVSNNQLSGEIPAGFCNATTLVVFDLSFNNLSGELPPCMLNTSSLVAINLQGNRFHGRIPDVSLSGNLEYIVLSDNQFVGALPRSIQNCTTLMVLDVGNNNITDTFPVWLQDFLNLQILILRSNNFYGGIGVPTVENAFRSLQILDLSLNSFSGSILAGFISNLGFMKNLTTSGTIGQYIGEYNLNAFNSGWRLKVILHYAKFNREFILPSFTIIDLSSNLFSGPIPETFGELKALKVLNLSNNVHSAAIPSSLANMGALESLDLSRNMLVGSIPQGLMELSFIEFLNVSYNKLEGKIPTGKRSDLFSSSSYIGNPGLCGLPLSKLC